MATPLDNLAINIGVNVTGIAQVQKVQTQVTRLDRTIKSNTSAYNDNAVAANKWAKGALQQAGYQVGDFAVQVANGTSKMQAFGQQGAQFAGVFGPAGAVIGAVIAVVSAVAVAMEKSAGKAKTLSEATSDLSDAFSMLEQTDVTKVFNDVGDQADVLKGKYADLLKFMNKTAEEQRARAVSDIASFMMEATDWQQAQEELLMQYERLSDLGAARTEFQNEALKDVTAELDKQNKAMLLIRSLNAETRQEATIRFNDTVRELEALGMMTPEIRAQLDLYAQNARLLSVVNQEIDEAEKGTEASARAAGDFADALRDAHDAARKVKEQIDGINASAISKLQTMQASLRGFQRGLTADEVRVQEAGIAAEKAAVALGVTGAELQFLVAEAMATERATIAASAALDVFTESTKRAGGGAKEVKKVAQEIKAAANAVESAVSGPMESGFMAMIDGTKSVTDAFKDMARDIIKELYRVLVVQRLVNSIAGAIGFMAGPATGNTGTLGLPSFDGGGWTGSGARAGGIDGKGGYPAIIHPREQVVDTTKGASTGSINITQNITFGSGVSRAEIQSMLPKIVETTKAAVFDAQRRRVNGFA